MNEGIVYIKVAPAQITDVNRIFEGYEYYALVSTVDRERGILKLRGTPDTLKDIYNVVENFPFPVQILSDFLEV